jgi:nuclear polyadenylated RNA-binding protein NAB2
MALQITADSDFAHALQGVIASKLAELGWSPGGPDDQLSEYVVLMLVNGKDQNEVAADIARDLLDLPEPDSSCLEFAQWLFEQVAILNSQFNPSSSDQPAESDTAMQGSTPSAEQQSPDTDRPIPTGPKAMLSNNGKPNGNRMFNQINRNMDRSGDSSLRRIQGAGGTGRINSHAGRGNIRGGKGQQIQRNFEGANRRAIKNGVGQGQFGNANFPMQGQGQMEQAQLLQMLEHQARIMTQIASSHGLMNPAFMPNTPFGQPQQSNARPLADRIGGKGQFNRKQRRPHGSENGQATEDTTMGEDGESRTDGNTEPTDVAKVVCKFNLFCTKADCPYAHQSPAAPPGVTMDLESECSFGVACKNHKCVSRHPSPAKKYEHQQQQDCKFGPFCQNAKCPFKHSTAKPCRNGGDCTTEGCPYFHSPIECKFNPCTNTHCIYRHKGSQRAKPLAGNVWTPEGTGSHISERKFVEDENEQEELIIPGSDQNNPPSAVIETAGQENAVMT